MAFRIGNRVTLRKPVNDWFNQLAPDSALHEGPKFGEVYVVTAIEIHPDTGDAYLDFAEFPKDIFDAAAFERVTDISFLLKRAPIRKLEPAK
jgi:hypothetical protein